MNQFCILLPLLVKISVWVVDDLKYFVDIFFMFINFSLLTFD